MTENSIYYMKNISIDDIPWDYISGPYERGNRFPEWIEDLFDDDSEVANKAQSNIGKNIEHQGTLWHVTPFVIAVLGNKLRAIIDKEILLDKDIENIVLILQLYAAIYFTADEIWTMEVETPLPFFSDMLKDSYLIKENNDLEEYYATIDNSLFMSFFHYSWMVIAYDMEQYFPLLEKLHDNRIKEVLNHFTNKEINLYIKNIMQDEKMKEMRK
ncbi:MAG: hypothetical protein ACK5LC_12825 [Coprobacillaceae bacterium]